MERLTPYRGAGSHHRLGVMALDWSDHADNRLDDVPMVPVECRTRGARVAGPQEQLESGQRAVERRRDGPVC